MPARAASRISSTPCRRCTHRAPGVVGAALDSGELWCGLIADGHHVHPAADRHRAARQAAARPHLPGHRRHVDGGIDQQTITLNGRTVRRRDGVLELEDGTLAGSDLDMMSGVRYLVKQVGVELGEALRMASTYPAEFLKRPELGRIAAGARADLVHIERRSQGEGGLARRRSARASARRPAPIGCRPWW